MASDSMGAVVEGRGPVIAFRPLLLAAWVTSAALPGFATDGQAQTSCTTVNDATFCTNGTTARRVGKTIHDNRGRSWTEVGDALYGNDGTTYNRVGRSVYDDKGNVWSGSGNTIRGSDGTSCSRIGNTLYCR